MSIIEIKGLSKAFQDKDKTVKALDNINLEINKGEIFGLLGVNGAGKTTLISILCGVLSKDKGEVSIFGMNLDTDLQKIKPRINIVSGFTMLDTEMNIIEYLKYYGLMYGVKDIKEKSAKLIKLLELENRKHKSISELSSGYKQRVLLAKSLMNDPDIIYMDEPTVGLDVDISKKIRNIIINLKKRGTTIIFTSHNLIEVEELCERIALLKQGKIIAQGTLKDIKKSINNNDLLEIICYDAKKLIQIIDKKLIKKYKILDNKLIIEAKSTKALDLIIKQAVNSEILITSFRKIEPSLEETFIDILGDKK